jgi:creatinine amidohydrolase
MLVNEMSDYDLRSSKNKVQIVIVPIGSLEQHGEHLPVSTDSIIVEHLAHSVSKKISSLVLPTFAYGVSFEHRPMFNLSLTNSTLSSVLSEICVSLCEYGFPQIVILNGHHGNMGLLQYISQNVDRRTSELCSVHAINYWHLLDREFDHAGFVETSLMLAIKPEIVNMSKARRGTEDSTLLRVVTSSILNRPNSFVKITETGVLGNPLEASAKVGTKLLKQITEGIVKAIHQFNDFSKDK